MKKQLLMLIIFISSNILAQGQVINVPGDQPTIQGAINASADGDTVLVADGTYYENIDYKGKTIIVASHYLVDEDETHIDNTIINGSQSPNPEDGAVVRFRLGEDTTSVLYGFTITGGTGGQSPPGSPHDAWGGGGIAIESGAKIIYNKIIFNSCTAPHAFVFGGGILIDRPERPILIIKNIIANNKLISLDQNEVSGGGGIFCNRCDKELLIADNIIANNSIVTPEEIIKGYGGGIEIAHSNATVKIRNNIIKNNSVRRGGGVEFVDYNGNEHPTLINNTIVNNVATDAGGAIYTDKPTTIVNSILWGNTAPNQSQIFSTVPNDVIVVSSHLQ
ncbi:right-handed parallel beta-helix repeat-containing protein [Candidatus Neomarinimicrobiota bacterium]